MQVKSRVSQPEVVGVEVFLTKEQARIIAENWKATQTSWGDGFPYGQLMQSLAKGIRRELANAS